MMRKFEKGGLAVTKVGGERQIVRIVRFGRKRSGRIEAVRVSEVGQGSPKRALVRSEGSSRFAWRAFSSLLPLPVLSVVPAAPAVGTTAPAIVAPKPVAVAVQIPRRNSFFAKMGTALRRVAATLFA